MIFDESWAFSLTPFSALRSRELISALPQRSNGRASRAGLLHSLDKSDPPSVAAPRKRGGQPDPHNFQRQLLWNHALAEGQNIAVVMFPRKARRLDIPAQRATNSADLIRDDGLTVPRTPENDASIEFAAGHRLRGRTYEQRIIHRGIAKCAEILHFVPETYQQGSNLFLVFEASMVGADRDFHSGARLA